MRCKQCGEYIPEGLGINQCFCGAELPKDTSPIEKENELITNESNAIEKRTQIVTESLTKKQEEKLNKCIEQEEKVLLIVGASFFVIIVLMFIPIYRWRGADLGGVSVMEFFGFIPTTLFLIIFYAVMFVYPIRKFVKLKKDLKEKQAITISTKVLSIEGNDKKGYKVFFEENEANIQKVHFYYNELPDIKEGDSIKLTLTPNAHFVLSTELNIKSSFKRIRYDRLTE